MLNCCLQVHHRGKNLYNPRCEYHWCFQPGILGYLTGLVPHLVKVDARYEKKTKELSRVMHLKEPVVDKDQLKRLAERKLRWNL